MSVNATNPGTLFGGSWEAIENTFLVAQGSSFTAGSTGGTMTHTHTTNAGTTGGTAITIAQMPSHNHNSKSLSGQFQTHSVFNPSLIHNASGICRGAQGNSSQYKTLDSLATNSGAPSVGQVYIDATHTHDSQGSGSAHTHSQTSVGTSSGNNLPPYMAVYMWKRTA